MRLKTELYAKEQGNKGDYLTGGNLKKNEDKIWEFFFRTERKLFQKINYLFHHMISTDGVGVSILFLRKDLVGKRITEMKKKENAELYVDELKYTTAYQSKKIVGIDPNKGDLIYCVDGCTKDSTTFHKISYHAIHNKARPSYLCRETQCIMPLHRVGNTPNVRRSVRTKP